MFFYPNQRYNTPCPNLALLLTFDCHGNQFFTILEWRTLLSIFSFHKDPRTENSIIIPSGSKYSPELTFIDLFSNVIISMDYAKMCWYLKELWTILNFYMFLPSYAVHDPTIPCSYHPMPYHKRPCVVWPLEISGSRTLFSFSFFFKASWICSS